MSPGNSAFPTGSVTFGSGPRKALAIHCTLAHSGAWEGIAKYLGQVLTLSAYDLPSHGRSGDWDGVVDFHTLATDMGRAFLTEPVDLIGHSFGATVALRLAVEHPDLVRSLTLIEPVFFAAALPGASDRVKAHDAAAGFYFKALDAGDMEMAARGFNRIWGDGTKWDMIPPKSRQYMIDRMHVVPATAAALYDDTAKILASGVLERATMPSLLIEGENSIDVVDAINGALARRLSDARRAVIAGAGHMAPITHPKQVGSAIAALLDVA